MAIYYAQVRMSIVRQVEFEASPDDDLDAIAEKVAIAEYGDCEDLEVIELDYRGLGRPTPAAPDSPDGEPVS